MTSPDAAQDKAHEAATAISEQAVRLWLEAHQNGMRNGIETTAQYVEEVLAAAQTAGVDPTFCEVLEGIRDNVRLMALQVPDPEVPDGSR